MTDNTPETPRMTAEDAAKMEYTAQRTTFSDVHAMPERDEAQRILNTYHALAASQQEVAELTAKVGRLQTSVLEVAILKSRAEQRLNACEMVRDMHLAECDALRFQLAAAWEDSARAERERDEMQGVIETFGRVELLTLEDRDELELRYRVSGLVLRAGGMDVFGHAIRECHDRWREKLNALRRAGMSTTEKMLEALADVERTARSTDAELRGTE